MRILQELPGECQFRLQSYLFGVTRGRRQDITDGAGVQGSVV